MIENRIISGARGMGVALSDGAAAKLQRFDALLREGNARMNLTRGMDDADEAVDRHYLDALTPIAAGVFPRDMRSLIDVGAGAGLPGLVLSVAMPSVRVVLLDSLGKRVAFVNDVIRELGLNAEAIHARAEDAGRDAAYREKFDCATARAVASLNTLCEWTLPFVRVGGALIAYKGPTVGDEAREAQNALRILGASSGEIVPAPIPERDWDHRLFIAHKRAATPAAYPRKPGEASRKPL